MCLPIYNFSHSIFDALIHLKALTQNKGSPDTQTSKQNQPTHTRTHTNAYKTWISLDFFERPEVVPNLIANHAKTTGHVNHAGL